MGRLAYRHSVDVIEPSTAEDTYGQPNGGKVIARNVPCSIVEMNARQLEIARQVATDATHEVKMLFDPAHRVAEWHQLIVTSDGGRLLNIASVITDVRNIEMTLLCGEVKA